MFSMFKFRNLLFLLVITAIQIQSLHAQLADINFKYKDFIFQTKYDSVDFSTELKIRKNKKVIYKKVYYDRITEIKDYDLEGNGNKEILIQMYSGGAHCCTSLFAGEIKDNRFVFTDSISWGNSFYAVTDLNFDKRQEIAGVSDKFAYAFTNYAQSQFNLLIYNYENGKFREVTKNFPKQINDDIEELNSELKTYTDTGFQCMEINEDTFNTDAGAVKAILAAITAEYYTLGEAEKGYELIDAVYKCPDKEKFVQILKNDFKLE